MSAYFLPDARFRKPANLRVRPVPEWGCVLVYTPSNPNLHYLDAHSWLVFELCDGSSFQDIRTEFRDCVPAETPEQAVTNALDDVMQNLLAAGVIEQDAGVVANLQS